MQTSKVALKTALDPEPEPVIETPAPRPTSGASVSEDEDRLINSDQLRSLIPVSDMTVWRWTKSRGFPTAIKLNNGRRYWRLVEVKRWIRARREAV